MSPPQSLLHLRVAAERGHRRSAIKCGKGYPWTEKHLQAAKDFANELDELNPDEKEKLNRSLDDLVREGAAVEIAGIRFNKLMAKVGPGSVETMKNILTDLLSEAAKRAVFGP